MTANAFDWDEKLPPETEDEAYGALLRALRRKQGFGLFFVQCSKAQGEKIVADLRRDLPQQQIQELHLTGEVVTLYDQIDRLWQQQPFDVLVVEGLQASLYAYEDTKRFSGWSSSDIYNYSWKGVPQLLNHLNQQREHLRNDFPARLVFLVPPFVVDYFIQRAADFLDWRSGLFRFPRNAEEIAEDAERFAAAGGYTKYLELPPEQRIEKILELKSLQESCSNVEIKTKFLVELGLLFTAEQDYGNALISWDKALAIKPDYHEAWVNRGNALHSLGRYEEAVVSCDQALKLKPDLGYVWRNRARELNAMGNYEEAILSLNEALRLRPDDRYAWRLRGRLLYTTKQYDGALASYDNALKIQPDKYAWRQRGWVLEKLNQHQEAISCFEKALEIDSDFKRVWVDRGRVLGRLKQTEEAVKSLNQSLENSSDDYYLWRSRGIALCRLKVYEEALVSLDRALRIPPSNNEADLYYVWKWRGYALMGLKRYQEAIISFNKALAFQPDNDFFDRYYAFGSRGLALWRLSQYGEAIRSFYKAIAVTYKTLQNAGLKSYKIWLQQSADILLINLRLKQFVSGLTALLKRWFQSQAICSFDAALKYSPDDYEAWDNLGNALIRLKHYNEAIASHNKALKIKPDYYKAWEGKGFALMHLRQFEAAHESFDQAILLNPEDAKAHYNKACCYALQGNVELAIENLQHAIHLDPDQSRPLATTDPDFDLLRDDARFQSLIDE